MGIFISFALLPAPVPWMTLTRLSCSSCFSPDDGGWFTNRHMAQAEPLGPMKPHLAYFIKLTSKTDSLLFLPATGERGFRGQRYFSHLCLFPFNVMFVRFLYVLLLTTQCNCLRGRTVFHWILCGIFICFPVGSFRLFPLPLYYKQCCTVVLMSCFALDSAELELLGLHHAHEHFFFFPE